MRLMGRVGLVPAAIVVANILMLHWSPLYADLIHPAQASAPVSNTSREAVESHLAVMGMENQDIAARMSELRPEDLAVLSQNPDQLQVAGTAPIVAVIFVFLGVIVAAVLFDAFSMSEEPEAIQPTQ